MPSEQRLHPASILFSLGSLVRSFALPGILVVVGGSQGWWGWQSWLLWLAIPYSIVGIGRYFTFRYRYEPHEMVIRTGFIFRNERHIPYARIQNLDGVQNVLHRLLGVVTVRVETGGGQEPEATMSVLPVAAFEEMRRRVFLGKEEAGEIAVSAPERALLQLPPRELLLCGLIENRGFVVLAAVFGVVWELGMFDRIMGQIFGEEEVSGRGLVRDLWRSLSGGSGFPVERIAIPLAAFLGFLLLIRLISMGWALVRLYGFRLSLAGEDLRTELGLLTRVVATIPLRRIQTLTIREGPLSRLFGRASVKVDTAGADGDEENKKQREWLAPIIRRDELPGLVRAVLPGLDLVAVAWNAAPPRAFRRKLKQWLIVTLPIALPFVLLLEWWDLALLPILFLWAFVGARQSVKHLGWAVTGDAVLFRSGWLWRQVSVARFAKIQAVAIHESPFDRRAAMARVRVDTAGAKDLAHRVDIPYLPRETARELCDLLAMQAARTAFRW